MQCLKNLKELDRQLIWKINSEYQHWEKKKIEWFEATS